MKVLDATEILAMIDEVEAEVEWTMYTPEFYPTFRAFILGAYLAADSVTQFSTRDVYADCTYIVSRHRADVILRGKASRCDAEENLIEYHDLYEDITTLFSFLQVAYVRAM